MLQPLNDVATFFLCSCCRNLFLFSVDVATSSRCRDFDVQSLENLMSRLPFGVMTSMSTALPLILSRPQSVVTTSYFFSSSICCFLTWSFCRDQFVLPSITLLLRLDFCGRDLDMNFHYCQGFTTSGPLILVHISCCNLLQLVMSVLLSHLLLLLLQYPLSFEFLAA